MKPVALVGVVRAPNTRATAMIAKPVAADDLGIRDRPAGSGRPVVLARRSAAAARRPSPTIMPPISDSSRTPLPSEFRPRTSRKYCGITKNTPNRAKEIMVDSVVPQVKPADRNSTRSISGCPPGRLATTCSQATNAAVATRPPPIVPRVTADAHPSWLAAMKPYVSAVSPALEISTPIRSMRGRRSLRDSGISEHHGDERDDHDGDVDQEDRAPPEMVKQPAAQDRARAGSRGRWLRRRSRWPAAARSG